MPKIYALLHVSESLLAYQNLFSQIYDWTKNGPKNRAILGKEAAEESALEFAYSYAGSLGVVLLAPSEREFFTGSLDPSIDRLFQVLNIDSQGSVREISREMGGAVIKRIHDWSRVNIGGGFATDVRWNRSDGRQLGEVIARARMEKIVGIIEATSDESVSVIDETGVLVGGDIGRGSFHFVVPNGPDYRGNFAADFQSDTELTLGRTYQAKIREKRTFLYATEREDIVRELLRLTPPSKANA